MALPGTDGYVKRLVPRVVERERRSRQPVDPVRHLGEHLRVEAAILLGREVEQPYEPVAIDHSHEVDEVAGFGTSEQGEQLVDGELFAGQQGQAGTFPDEKQACVASEINFGPVLAVVHEQPDKA